MLLDNFAGNLTIYDTMLKGHKKYQKYDTKEDPVVLKAKKAGHNRVELKFQR